MVDVVGAEIEGCEAVLLITSLSEEQRKLRAELARAREQIESLQARLDAVRESEKVMQPKRVQLPILCRDLARWSTPVELELEVEVVVVPPVPAGPPPLPPTVEDIESIVQVVSVLRRLVHTPIPTGKPYHAGFDPTRYQALQARYREAAVLADKLFGQVEKSRSQKDLSWHLMVTRRIDEVNRKRR